MYRLWIYVFCSVIVRACLGIGISSGKKSAVEDVRPSDAGIYNGTENFDSISSKIWDTRHSVPRYTDFDINEDKSQIFSSRSTEDVCYEDLGCFSMSPPWKSILRPVGVPIDPKDLNATVRFFSRINALHPFIISLYPEINLEGIPFYPNRSTVIITHGFASSGLAEWITKMKDSYLTVRDVNLFTLDWGRGAQKTNYLQVVGNTRTVGKELANLIETLIDDYDAEPEDFHLIGHSLGAHICSYAAKEIPGIGRLTALDPAQPCFEGFSEEVRLDKSDAEFVEVIHTDARPFIPTMGFGMILPYGHVDYYLNGGFGQPGCLIPNKPNIEITSLASLGKVPVEALYQVVACPHSKSYEYYTESLDTSKCTFWGSKLKFLDAMQVSMTTFMQGIIRLPLFTKCSPETCIPLGLDAIKSPLRGSFLVVTHKAKPYCELRRTVPFLEMGAKLAETARNAYAKLAETAGNAYANVAHAAGNVYEKVVPKIKLPKVTFSIGNFTFGRSPESRNESWALG